MSTSASTLCHLLPKNVVSFLYERMRMIVTPTTTSMIVSAIVSTSAIAQSDRVDNDAGVNFYLNPQTINFVDGNAEITDTQSAWTVMATAHSPAQPISEFLDDWDAPLDSGDHAYVQGRASFEIRPANSAISYGLGWRYDYLMSFSEQTAKVYWQYENQQPPSTSQTYPLYLEAKHNERIGANIGFTKKVLPNWQLTTRANIWQGLHALDGKIVGDLSTIGLPASEVTNIRDSLDETHADINYYYDKPALGEENLGWNPNKPSGYGYSFDLQLKGDLSENTKLSIDAYDVLGRMYWKEMPSTRYTLDYDIDGRPLYTIEGQLDTDDVTQTLPWRVEGSLQHQINNHWQLGLQGQVNDIQDLYQLSAGYQTDYRTYPMTITGLIEPQTHALGLALDSQYGGIRLLTDSLDWGEAKRSEVSLYGQYAW